MIKKISNIILIISLNLSLSAGTLEDMEKIDKYDFENQEKFINYYLKFLNYELKSDDITNNEFKIYSREKIILNNRQECLSNATDNEIYNCYNVLENSLNLNLTHYDKIKIQENYNYRKDRFDLLNLYTENFQELMEENSFKSELNKLHLLTGKKIVCVNDSLNSEEIDNCKKIDEDKVNNFNILKIIGKKRENIEIINDNEEISEKTELSKKIINEIHKIVENKIQNNNHEGSHLENSKNDYFLDEKDNYEMNIKEDFIKGEQLIK